MFSHKKETQQPVAAFPFRSLLRQSVISMLIMSGQTHFLCINRRIRWHVAPRWSLAGIGLRWPNISSSTSSGRDSNGN